MDMDRWKRQRRESITLICLTIGVRIRRRLGPNGPRVALVEGRSAEVVMSRILSAAAAEPVIVGFGNFVGWGEEISRYWDDQGTEHGA